MDNKYDAVIIGAGIGGLVCGCYLAKAGMKVAIFEQHNKPGGYCTSFKRDGFTFDAVVRGLVGGARHNILGKILDELGIYKKIELMRSDIFDLIITKDYKIPIKNDINETRSIIIDHFKKEKKQIIKFFELLKEQNFISLYGKLNNISFKKLLDQFFNDKNLKSFWNIMRADTGLSPSKTSALAGLALCRGYLLDGGYYPRGGMQNFSNIIAATYKDLGGDIVYSERVQKIKLNNKKEVIGINLKKDTFIKADYVISNSDAMATYFDLIGQKYLNAKFTKLLKSMKTSTSAFILYLGLNTSLKKSISKCCSVWYFPKYLEDQEYDFTNKINFNSKCFICAFPSFMDETLAPKESESLYLYAGAPYKNEKFWDKYRGLYENYLLEQLSGLFPGIKNKIEVKDSATPLTFNRYTSNHNGATRGWATTVEQAADGLITQETFFKNLFLAGHWITLSVGNGGVAMAAYTGRSASKLILKKKKQLMEGK